MEHEKKLAFIAKMTKMGLDHIQHLDSGGSIVPNNPINASLNGPTSGTSSADTNVGVISDFFGIANNFHPDTAPLQQGTDVNQLNTAYLGANNAINAQTGLVNETRPGVTQGLGAQSTLSDQLTAEANGEGPNPAQAALEQSTGQNVATTAAQLAGARGGSSNVGLLARQIGQQGAATQQQAVGQAATLQAQQKLAAQQELQNLAATQVGQGTGAVTTLNQEQQNEQNILQGANTSANNANVAMQSNINNTNAATAAANAGANKEVVGSILSGGGTAVLGSLAKGGLVKMDKGGNVLDSAARKHIAPHNFALPGARYPIHDISHARNALARVSQNGTPDEKRKVKTAVHKKYPSLAGKKMAEGGEVSDDTEFEPTAPEVSESPTLDNDPNYPSGKKKKGGLPISSLTSLIALLSNGGEVKNGYMGAKHMATGGYLAPTPLVVNNSSSPQSFVGQWVNSNVTPSSGPSIGSPVVLPETHLGKVDLSKASGVYKKFKQNSQSQSTKTDGTDIDPGSNLDATNDSGFTNNAVDTGSDIGAGASDVGDAAEAFAYRGGLAAKGGNVRAANSQEKAKVKGDNLKNDKIPTMLSEGEVVMDRDTLSDPGPVGQMARAVAKHIEKRNKGKK